MYYSYNAQLVHCYGHLSSVTVILIYLKTVFKIASECDCSQGLKVSPCLALDTELSV